MLSFEFKRNLKLWKRLRQMNSAGIVIAQPVILIVINENNANLEATFFKFYESSIIYIYKAL